MRASLQVPFAEKDDAKGLGARWDPARKVWYVENQADLSPFARWLPANNPTPGVGAPSPKPPSSKDQSTAGITVVGSRFVEYARVCTCLPWEDCDKCRSATVVE
ncbi:MAG: DUF5710 domain-containing protein [Sterolibacteriaceae bacterium MAG5]|nr:DUF5710 domain-containing protein [Candidatus Nitricoxidireducens bremensis]